MSTAGQVLARLRKLASPLDGHATYGPRASIGVHHEMPNGRDMEIIPAPPGVDASTEVIVADELSTIRGDR